MHFDGKQVHTTIYIHIAPTNTIRNQIYQVVNDCLNILRYTKCILNYIKHNFELRYQK